MGRMDREALFRTRLREAREHSGLTHDELSAAAGLHITAISHFECGRRLPSFHNLIALARALNVSADELLGL